MGLIPRLGSSARGRHGNPLLHSALENPMDRGTWWAMVHSITKSQECLKQLSTHSELEKKIISTQNLQIYSLEVSLVIVK